MSGAGETELTLKRNKRNLSTHISHHKTQRKIETVKPLKSTRENPLTLSLTLTFDSPLKTNQEAFLKKQGSSLKNSECLQLYFKNPLVVMQGIFIVMLI